MEAIFSSETSVDFERTTQYYIPYDINPDNHCCENLKSYTQVCVQCQKRRDLLACLNLPSESKIDTTLEFQSYVKIYITYSLPCSDA
jgi:hypothetical protein